MPRGSDLDAGRKVQYNRVLTAKCVKWIARMAASDGYAESAVIETLVREEAYKRGYEEDPRGRIHKSK